jgi:hypothetical protein
MKVDTVAEEEEEALANRAAEEDSMTVARPVMLVVASVYLFMAH